jgi:hypothetical protein
LYYKGNVKMITNDTIIALKPCKDRLANYLLHYSNVTLTHDQFLDSTLITYSDKVWVYERILTKPQLVHWGALCAQSVLHIYEAKYPNDSRPRDLVEYLLSGGTDETETKRLKGAASAAYVATYATSAAAYAAAYAAYAASAAAYAAYAAYATYATYAAASAAASAASAVQQDLNLSFIKEIIK